MLKRIVVCSALLLGLFVQRSDAAEICGNGIDDDADGLADESCTAVVCENPLSCSDTGMVSPGTGALSYKLPPDIAPKVPYGPGIGFARTYQSMYSPGGSAPAYRKSMGERWTHTYASWLDKDTVPNPDQIVLHMSQGRDTLLKFTSTVSGWEEYRTFQPGFHAQYLRQRVAAPYEYQLKLLTGEIIVYNSSGKLIEIWDTLATPNKVIVTYDGNGMISTVIDASTKRRLLFAYAGSLMTSVAFQIYISGAWTAQHTTTYGYTSSNLTSVNISGELAQTNVYTSNYLTQIQDGAGNSIVNFAFNLYTAGVLNRVDTTRGMVGFEYNSSRADCSGKTVMYFNLGNTTSCTADADCGTGFLCGGRNGASPAGGKCFRAARCLTISSPSEDVVTTVTPLGPPGQSCTGACTDVGAYVWNTGASTLDLKATQDPGGNFTSREFYTTGASAGMVKTINYGDVDSDPTNTNAARAEYFTYDTTFPGRVLTSRRKSDLSADPCSATDSRGCTITTYAYNTDGKPSSVSIGGYTLNASNFVVAFTATTSYIYNTYGQLTQIDGPLSGSNDLTVLGYWTSPSDPLKDKFPEHFERKKAGFDYITTSFLTYDFRGNATSILTPDGSVSCQTYDARRGFLAERRETMAGQSDCTTNSADLVTSWTRDSNLRVTRLTRPDGSCLFYEYDTKGRLVKTKRRDDCNAASSGDRQEFTYDNDGLLTKIEAFDAASTVTWRKEMTYLDGRQLEHIINPTAPSTFVNFVYDARGLVIEVDGESSLSKATYTINADNRTTAVTRNKTSTTSDTWLLGYAWPGDQVSVTDADSKVTQTVRDDLGRTVRLVSPDMNGPTLQIYNVAGRMTDMKEAYGVTGAKAHTFTYDNIGRPLDAFYADPCTSAPAITRSYDGLPGGVSCPTGVGCARTNGRLAYVKTTLKCTGGYDGGPLNQETFYSYDDAGRMIREYIRDNSSLTTPRIGDQQYGWTKNGALAQTTMPSGAVHGWTYGSAGSNSDTDLVTGTWRTSTSTPIIDTVLWNPYGPLKQYNQENWYTGGGGLGIRTRIVRDVAYRLTRDIVETQTGSVAFQRIDPYYDTKGRVVRRDYDNSYGQVDSYFLYDQQGRVLCETTTLVSSCPTSGTEIKNSHPLSPPFTNAGDWKRILRPIPGSTGGLINDFNSTGYGASHRIVTVAQTDGTPALGTTEYSYDARGNRSQDGHKVRNVSTHLRQGRDEFYVAAIGANAIGGV